MALLLKLKTPTGVSANYHKLANLLHNTDLNQYSAVLYSYYNKGLRDKGCVPIWGQKIEVFYSVEGENDVTNVKIGDKGYKFMQRIEMIDFTRTNLYNIIKLLPEWTNAQDHLIDQVVNAPEIAEDEQNIPI